MKHLHFTIPVIIVLVIIGIFSTIVWFRSPLFGQWAKNQYFGEVVEIREDSLTLRGKNNATKKIFYDTKTRIMKGSHVVSRTELFVNKPVIVIAEPDSTGELHAKAIRIFTPKKQ
jgi:hypothetical protein